MTSALTLIDLPEHYVKDRAAWRRRMARSRRLSYGARWYGGYLAFHRFGKGRVAWVRDKAAAALGVTVRTIQRWTAELVAAGWLDRLVDGYPGRCQVFRLASPQVAKGDTTVSPSRYSRTRPASSSVQTPTGQAHYLANQLLNATPARQPRRNPPPDHLTTAETAGDGTRTTTRTQ